MTRENRGSAAPKTLYEDVAERITKMIDQGIFRAGERIPSVRALSRQLSISVGTVLEAYNTLEDRGVIRARPQSGYYVNARVPAIPRAPDLSRRTLSPTRVGNSALSLSILRAAGQEGVIPLGAAIPDPDHLPIERLNRMLAAAVRRHPVQSVSYDVPPGCGSLRAQIAKRSLTFGCSLAPEEIVTTAGCVEAVMLALRATCKPGDVVVVESPTYYNFLLLIENLNLRALEVPCHPRDGISIEALRYVLDHNRIGACLFNLNFNNPLGSLIPTERKRELVELLAAREIPLIEDDIHGDLTFIGERPITTRAFDSRGLVLLCSSFSKTLAPGYRVGWVAPGRYQAEVEQIKLMTNISTPTPTQLAVAEFLGNGGYDRHLRRLCRVYASQTARMAEAVGRCFPKGTRVSRPEGGHFLWVEMPEELDSFSLYEQAMSQGISITPGPIFSATGKYANCIRLNASSWSGKVEQAIETLGGLAKGLSGNPGASARS
jgi:DNA-binding transcriptional MocR family regulator